MTPLAAPQTDAVTRAQPQNPLHSAASPRQMPREQIGVEASMAPSPRHPEHLVLLRRAVGIEARGDLRSLSLRVETLRLVNARSPFGLALPAHRSVVVLVVAVPKPHRDHPLRTHDNDRYQSSRSPSPRSGQENGVRPSAACWHHLPAFDVLSTASAEIRRI